MIRRKAVAPIGKGVLSKLLSRGALLVVSAVLISCQSGNSNLKNSTNTENPDMYRLDGEPPMDVVCDTNQTITNSTKEQHPKLPGVMPFHPEE